MQNYSKDTCNYLNKFFIYKDYITLSSRTFWNTKRHSVRFLLSRILLSFQSPFIEFYMYLKITNFLILTMDPSIVQGRPVSQEKRTSDCVTCNFYFLARFYGRCVTKSRVSITLNPNAPIFSRLGHSVVVEIIFVYEVHMRWR